mgnify:CR=1 FL=1
MKTCGQCSHYSPAVMMCAWKPNEPEPCWAFGAYAELQRRRSDLYQADGCAAFEERQKAELTSNVESVTVKS